MGGGGGSGEGHSRSCSLKNTKYTHTCESRALSHAHKQTGVHIFNMLNSELFKLVVNLTHKVALSPHVISVWIKMDYWITRPAHADRKPAIRKYGKSPKTV